MSAMSSAAMRFTPPEPEGADDREGPARAPRPGAPTARPRPAAGRRPQTAAPRAAEPTPARDEIVRRRAIALMVTVALLAAVLVFLTASRAKAELERPRTGGFVTVQPGETLWEVAAHHAPPGVDPREYLQRLRELNRIGTGPMPPWTVLLLPVVP